MVGGQEYAAAHLLHGGLHPAYAGIHGLHGLDGGLEHAGMAHHVAVGVVKDKRIIFAGLHGLHHFVRDLIGAHLRLEVIGGHGGGLYQYAVLAGVLFLHAAVEEEGHVGVLLGLGYAQLGQIILGEVLAKGVLKALGLIGHVHVGHGGVVLGHAHVGEGEETSPPFEARKVRVDQGAGYLPCPVGAEVVEDNGVAALDRLCALHHRGHHKLVGDVLVIGVLHSAYRAFGLLALAVDHGGIGLFDALPAVITVHGVVAAHDRGHLAHADFLEFFHELLHIVLAAGGGHVPAVQEAVDEHLLKASLFRHFQKGVQVGVMAVHAAVG